MVMIRGINLELHQNEDFSNAIRRDRDFYEADILDYLADYHRDQKTILDIGANIGNHSVYFANFLNYTSIMAFEPIKANFELLKQNMAPYGNTSLIQMAVSATTHRDFRMFENHGNMGNGRADMDGNIFVNATSIDRLYLTDVTLMKIDVENHEPAVIEGAADTLYRCHPLIEDWDRKYDKLLKDYVLEKAWDHHRTYLYRWEYYARVYGGGL
jgi:FkbM family methyltransferase